MSSSVHVAAEHMLAMAAGSNAAGTIAAGGFITGPIKPSFCHPEWQGSVSAHWMDRGSGYQRGFAMPHHDVTDGYNGVARKGFGPFAIDAGFRVYEEGLRRTKQFPEQDFHVAPWGDHPQEYKWRPSRRKLEDHEFKWRVGASTMHGGLLAHVDEPSLLSKRPPFVDKKGVNALPNLYEPEMERCRQNAFQKQLLAKRKAAAAEDRWERTQVLDLESWEKSHVRKHTASSPSLQGSRGPSDPNASRTMRKPQRSASEGGLQFTRQQR